MKLDTPIKLDAAEFFHWWGSELAFLVPARLRKLLGGNAAHLLLQRRGDRLDVVYRDPEGERELGVVALDEAGAGQRERLLKDRPELDEAKVVLQLAAGQALRRCLKLPMAAEENLAQVIAFEMDRLTPFKSDQVYYGARVVERHPATRQLSVEIAVAPREMLDGLLEELALCGWQPDIVDVAGDTPPGTFNLLPAQYRPVSSAWPRIANMVLAALIVVLALCILVLPSLVDRTLMLRQEQEVRKAGKTASEVEALRQETDQLLHETRFILEKKRTEPVMADMLEELSRVIPDNTWLNGLQYRERRVVIQGQSPSASTLIELIEASDYFENTSFVSPVTKDTASGLERFQIASNVVNGRFAKKTDSPE